MANHPGTAAKWNLQAKAGQAGRDTEAGRWGEKIGHSDCPVSIRSAGGHASSATAMGPNVFQSQLRVSTGAIGASSCSAGTAVYC